MLIICCGMPRSGSTLQFNITWKLAVAGSVGSRVEWRSQSDWESSVEELMTMAHSRELYVIKMHSIPSSLSQLAQSSGKVKFVYVHRDIRDVVVSMKVKFNYTLNKAIRRINDTLELEKWLSQLPQGSVLVQDYEKLLRSLPQAIKEIADFLGIPAEEKTISSIRDELDIASAYSRSRAKQVPFEHIRRKIKFLLGKKATFADNELMLHPGHVSSHKGEIGIWENTLTENEISIIERHFGPRIKSGFHV